MELEPEVNTNWSSGVAKRLQDYAFKAAGLSWMYGSDAAYYNSIDRKTNIVIGVLAAVSSVGITGIFALVDTRQCTEPNPGFYVVTAISVLLTVIIAVLNRYQAAMNFNYKIAEFSEKAVKFGSLYRTINNEFNTPSHNRHDSNTLLLNIERRYEELDREKPFLRDSTVDEWGKYLSSAKSTDLNMDVVISIPPDLQGEVPRVADVYENNELTNSFIRINAT